MGVISELIKSVAHRPYEMPSEDWRYYQEWNNALFMHWKVPMEQLKSVVPKGLEIDTLNGEAWVSLVAFTMQKIRPKLLPSLKVISDFHEINLRTYVINDGKPGVYFINIEAEKALSAFVAKNFSGLPYQKSSIDYQYLKEHNLYLSKSSRGTYLEAEFKILPEEYQKTHIDRWLTERYCLYMDHQSEIWRYDIHHAEWEINDIKINRLKLNYKVKQLVMNNETPDCAHYSKGVKVVAWRRKVIQKSALEGGIG